MKLKVTKYELSTSNQSEMADDYLPGGAKARIFYRNLLLMLRLTIPYNFKLPALDQTHRTEAQNLFINFNFKLMNEIKTSVYEHFEHIQNILSLLCSERQRLRLGTLAEMHEYALRKTPSSEHSVHKLAA